MGAQSELRRLLERAGVTPYRRVGKVRLAHDPRTPAATLAAAVGAVRVFAPALVDEWGEPSADVAEGWRRAGLVPAEVCDDPCPAGVDPMLCAPGWLVDRCPRYHFRLIPGRDGGLGSVRFDGWSMAGIEKLLPGWFAFACRSRRAELAAAVAAVPPCQTCPRCSFEVYEPADAGRLCDRGGCPFRAEGRG